MRECTSCSKWYVSGGLDYVRYQCWECAKDPNKRIRFNSLGEPIRVDYNAPKKVKEPTIENETDGVGSIDPEDFIDELFTIERDKYCNIEVSFVRAIQVNYDPHERGNFRISTKSRSEAEAIESQIRKLLRIIYGYDEVASKLIEVSK